MDYKPLLQILQQTANYHEHEHNDSGDAYEHDVRAAYRKALEQLKDSRHDLAPSTLEGELQSLPGNVLEGEEKELYARVQAARSPSNNPMQRGNIDWNNSNLQEIVKKNGWGNEEAKRQCMAVEEKYAHTLAEARKAMEENHFRRTVEAEGIVYNSGEAGKRLILAKYDLDAARSAFGFEAKLLDALNSDRPIEAFFGGERIHLGAVNELYVQAVKLAEIEGIELHDAMKQNVLRIGGSEKSAHMLADYAVHQKAHFLGDAGAIDAFIDKYTGKGAAQAAEKERGWVKRLMEEPWLGKKGLVFGAGTVALCGAAYLGYEALRDKDNGQQSQR